jgi:hypothetical protein
MWRRDYILESSLDFLKSEKEVKGRGWFYDVDFIAMKITSSEHRQITGEEVRSALIRHEDEESAPALEIGCICYAPDKVREGYRISRNEKRK